MNAPPKFAMSAVAVAGWQLQRQARDGAGGEAKRVVARFFAEQIATEALGLKAAATAGASLLYALGAETLAG